jgi:DNA ligase (NAD+)
LHNQDEIGRKDIRIGDTVWIHKAGEIIPEILRVDTDARTGLEVPFKIPEVCPVCGTTAIRLPDESAVRCPNKSCPAQLQEELLHFVSRDCMDINGIGEKLIRQLTETGLVQSAADIYGLTAETLAGLERMAEKSAHKTVDAIETSKKRPFYAVLNALGIRNVGKKTAKDIASRFRSIDKLISSGEEELASLEGVGSTIAASIKSHLADDHNMSVIERLRSNGIKMADDSPEKTSESIREDFAGKKMVFTGELSSMSRSEAEKLAESYGASTSGSVSKKTDIVIVGENAGSKYNKALSLGVTIWNEAEFLEKIK